MAIIIALDMLTKSAFDGKVLEFIPGFISIFGLAHNTGGAFSLFEGAIWLFLIFAVIFYVVMVLFEAKSYKIKKNFTYYVGFGLMIAGTMGNFIDRILFGYVRDFIKFEFMDFPIFNIADIALNIGVVFVAIWLIFFCEKEGHFKALPKEKGSGRKE